MRFDASIELSQFGATRAESWTLIGLELREFLDRPYRLTLRVSTADSAPEAAELLGARAHVLVTDESGAELQVSGVLHECRYERTIDGKTHMKWVAGPAIGMSSLQRRTRQFVDTDAIEILRSIAQPAFERFGGAVVLSNLQLKHGPRDYCVQRNEDDLAFLLRILSAAGIFWTFDWAQDHEVMVLHDESMLLSNAATNRVLPFSPSGRALTPAIRMLDYGVQLRAENHRVTSWDWKAPVSAVLESKTQTPFAARFGTVEESDPQRMVEADAGDGPLLDATSELATLAAERAAMEAWFVHAESNVLDLRPGTVFAVEAHPNPDLEQDVLVTEVIHMLDARTELDGTVAGYSYENTLNAIPAAVRYRPPVRRAPRVSGPETALVVGDPKSETVTDAHGRVRVRFHWAGEQESCFIRVAQAWAGHGFGTLFVPRPGMEVVVHYLGGDPECPLITGSVYNAQNTSPYPLPEDRARSTIRTQTYPDGDGGNELRFDDTRGRQQVALKAQRRLDVCVSSSSYETTGRNREVRVGGKDEGDMNVLVRHDHNHWVEENDYQLVGNEQHRSVEGTAIDRVEVSRYVSTGESHTVEAQSILTQVSDSIDQRCTTMRMEGTNEVDVLGAYISIEATHRMSLRAGDAFITLDPYEGIRLHGVTIGLNSGGSPTSAEAPEAAESVELIKPIEAYGANCGCNAGKWKGKGGGGGRQHQRVRIDPHEPAPYPPGPFPPESEEAEAGGACRVAEFWAMCGHGRMTNRDFLEVVPTQGTHTDTVNLSVELTGSCEGETSWDVFGEKSLGTGTAVVHTVKAPKTMRYWPVPTRIRDFATQTIVLVTPPGGATVSKSIWAFPSAQADVEVEIPLDDINAFLAPLFEMELVKTIIEVIAEDAKFQPEVARGYARAGFAEYWGPESALGTPQGSRTDNRAYFGYDLGFQLKGEFGGKAGIPVGRLLKVLKKALKIFEKFKYFKQVEKFLLSGDLTADAILYIAPDIDVQWLRTSPDDPRLVEPTPDSHIKNKIQVGFELGVKIPFKVPIIEYESEVEVTLEVVAVVSFSGRPYLSDTTLGANISYELTDIIVKNAALKGPFLDPLEKKDYSLLSDAPKDREARTLSIDFDLSWILKALKNATGGSP